MHKKKIAIFTGTRAEYGLLRKLAKEINGEPTLELQLIVSGSHLSTSYGYTISEIEADDLFPAALVPLSLDEIPQPSMAHLASEALVGVAQSLQNLKPHLLVLLGDRYEAFAAASAAHLQGIPICHLHGGESTLGAVDDRLRHAITQLSTWHFTAAYAYQQRVISMGLPPNNVFNVGPMVLDELYDLPPSNRSDFEKLTGYRFSTNNILVTYHPETLLEDRGLTGFQNLLQALHMTSSNILFTYPNSDEGSKSIIRLIEDFVIKSNGRSWAFPSLGHENFLKALQLFDIMVGNSSSGVIEAPYLGIPVVNIGDRQMGRIRNGYILDVSSNFDAILAGVQQALVDSKPKIWPQPRSRVKSRPSEAILNWLRASNSF